MMGEGCLESYGFKTLEDSDVGRFQGQKWVAQVPKKTANLSPKKTGFSSISPIVLVLFEISLSLRTSVASISHNGSAFCGVNRPC